MKTESTTQKIIAWLKPPGRSLTRLKAFTLFHTMSLNSRISDIRKMGIPVMSEWIKDKKSGKLYKKYFLR